MKLLIALPTFNLYHEGRVEYGNQISIKTIIIKPAQYFILYNLAKQICNVLTFF